MHAGTDYSTIVMALAFVASAACTSPPRSPAQGGPRWFEVTTARFVLRTDLDEDAARAAARDFEAAYLYLEQVAFPSYSEPAQRLDVVLFRNEGEFHHFWPSDMTGFYTDQPPRDLERAPTMVLYGPLQGSARVSFLHELTHRFVARAYGWAPTWMQEGLAQYFSTMRIEGSRAILGEVPEGALISRSLVPTVQEIVTADHAAFYGVWNGEDYDGPHRARYYAGAYALVHLLRHGPDPMRGRFDAFVNAMNDGARADVAWAAAFGGIPADALESAFRKHVAAAREWDLMAAPVEPPPDAPAERIRPLADEEVHVLWGRVIPRGDKFEKVREQLDEALAQAPASALVAYARGCFELEQDRLPQARALFEAALREDPDNPRVLYALLQTRVRAGDSSDSIVDLLDRLDRSARSADELGALALYASSRGDHDAALRRAQQAVEADPSYARARAIRARVHFEASDFASAVTDQERAVALLPEQVDPRPIEEGLEEYRRMAASNAAAAKGTSASPPSATEPTRPAAAIAGEWSCRFPPEADTDEVDHAAVKIRVDVDSSGNATRVAVLDDPGHGFGRQAQACAMNMQYRPALDGAGRPTDGRVTIRVRFSR